MFLSCFATCLWFFSFGLPSLRAWPPNGSKPKRGANLKIKFATVTHFRTSESPEPKRGANLKLKFATVTHFRTPESPEPKRGANLNTQFATVTHFYKSADPLSGRACEDKPIDNNNFLRLWKQHETHLSLFSHDSENIWKSYDKLWNNLYYFL